MRGERHYRIVRQAADGRVVCEEVSPAGLATPVEHMVYHSPTGFEYGYAGSGPSDLARSIVWHHTGYQAAPEVYQRFKDEFIVALDGAETQHTIGWTEVEEWLIRHS